MISATPIRVMLVDDHTMVRRGLAAFLKIFDDMELVGETSNGEAAIQLCAQIRPDIILMDLVMPDMDGVMATHIIRQKFPTIKIIALTSFKEKEWVQNVLQAGAISYLLKDISAEKLAQAIRAAHIGRSTLASEAIQVLVQATTNQPLKLTKRERSVLLLMIEGLNNSEIAEKLTVSPSTIKSHVSHILAKLGVTSRTEAVVLAVRQHLVE